MKIITKILSISIVIILFFSCKTEIKKTIPEKEKITEIKVEIPKLKITEIKIDTTFLFKAWVIDRYEPVADFLLTKNEYISESGSGKYSLIKNLIVIEFEKAKLEGEILKLSKDTLKIRWKDSNVPSVYISYKNGYGFSRKEIVETLDNYSNNYGKVDEDYVIEKLNPKLTDMKNMICENNDVKLLDNYLKMLLNSKGSADEFPSYILGQIFICKPKIIKEKLENEYKNEHLRNILEFGFLNVTHKKETEIQNFKELKSEIDKLIVK